MEIIKLKCQDKTITTTKETLYKIPYFEENKDFDFTNSNFDLLQQNNR